MTSWARVPRVLLITDATHPRGLVPPVLDALSGLRSAHGLHVQLRAKALSARALVDAGRAIADVLVPLGGALIVNGRADVAAAVAAAGVHAPESGLAVDDVRAVVPHAITSRACNGAQGLARAARERADYAVLSPIFAVPGKGRPLGVATAAELIGTVGLPVIALGGITFDTASRMISSGAAGIAVIRDVLHARSPAAQLARLLSVTAEALR